MKDIISLVYCKIIAALPTIINLEAAFYRKQIEVLLRILEDKGVKRILATPEEIQ